MYKNNTFYINADVNESEWNGKSNLWVKNLKNFDIIKNEDLINQRDDYITLTL